MKNISKWLNIEIPAHPSITTRAIYFFISLIVLVIVSWTTTGAILHSDNQLANIFQSGLLLIVLGSILLEDKFTKPVDALVNSLTSFISLLGIYGTSAKLLWLVLLFYSIGIFVASLTNLLTIETIHENWKRINRLSYFISKNFGKAQVIFSMLFLLSVYSKFGQDETTFSVLVLFWAFYLGLHMLRVPHFLQGIWENRQRTGKSSEILGVVLRVDYPNIIKTELLPEQKWSTRKVVLVCLGDGKSQYVQPLYSQIQDKSVIGTGIILQNQQVKDLDLKSIASSLKKGYVYTISDEPQEIAKPLGFVLEGSTIEKLVFETWKPDNLNLGLLVSCEFNKQTVYYQIGTGTTKEEAFKSHEYGFQVVEAFQLGRLENGSFIKSTWFPPMNAPVFKVGIIDDFIKSEDIQELGKIPSTDIPVYSSISRIREFHSAILGVTGVGKTCLAHTLIQDAVKNKVKVICIDPSGDYKKSNTLKV